MVENGVHLFCYPLEMNKRIKTFASILCFQLIWLKCCYTHSFNNITIAKKDRARVDLQKRSFIRGIEDLEKSEIITVERKQGKANRISVNTELLDQKSKDFILKGKKVGV